MNIIRIIKAKLRDKDKIKEDWYLERLKICGGCEYNSKNYNKKKGLWYWFWNTLNFKKPFCTICGCEIKAKASEKEIEECSLSEIGEEPKWTKII